MKLPPLFDLIDEDHQQIEIVPRNDLYLFMRFEIREAKEQKFDETYLETLLTISQTILELRNIWRIASADAQELRLGVEDVEVGILSLTEYIASSIECCVDLLRRGYRFQIGIIIRNTIESLCVVLSMAENPEFWDEAKLGKFKSGQATRYVKAKFPEFVKRYGFLSNSFVHVTEVDYFRFSPLGSESDPKATVVCIQFIMETITFAAIVFERAFYKHVREHTFWYKESDKNYRFRLSQNGVAWLSAIPKLLDELDNVK